MFLTFLAIYILIGCVIMLIIERNSPDMRACFENSENNAWLVGCYVGTVLCIIIWPAIIAKGVIAAFKD